MFKQKTVFVLGAGISASYGFPSGATIVQQLTSVDGVDQARSVFENVIDAGATASEIVELGRALLHSQQSSIDAFLEHRTEFLKTGRLMLARLVGSAENSTVFQRPGCLKLIVDKIADCSRDHFCDNAVSFITFNYDRSLEHYLFTVLRNRYGVSPDGVKDLLESIPIVHIYGQLGYLDWQKELLRRSTGKAIFDESMPVRPYNGIRDHMDIREAASGIRIISESEENTPTIKYAQRLINSARSIFILGFGYHPENMRRLGLIRESAKLSGIAMGTWHGLTWPEAKALNKRYIVGFEEHVERKADEFLRNCSRFVDPD